MKKIGLDARMLGPRQTGIGNYIKNLIEHILQIDQQNQYFIFLLPGEFDQFQIKWPNVKKIKASSRWYSLAEQSKLLLRILKYNLDLIHFPHFNLPVLYPKKFIVTIHDLTQNYFPGRSAYSKIRYRAYQYTFKTAVNCSQKIIAVSLYTKNDLLQLCGNKKEIKSKTEVVYEGIDPVFLKDYNPGLVKKFRQKYKLKNPYILYIGVWRKHKNLAALLYAFQILKKKFKLNYDLCLVGEEHYSYPIKKIWQSLNIEDYIKTTGFLSTKELALAYKGASLYCLPSLREGFGLTPLEAMASATPVLSSNTTALPEILGNAALFFNPYNIEELAEKMVQILTNNRLKKQLIQKGRQRIKKYNWDKCAQKTFEIYQSIL